MENFNKLFHGFNFLRKVYDYVLSWIYFVTFITATIVAAWYYLKNLPFPMPINVLIGFTCFLWAIVALEKLYSRFGQKAQPAETDESAKEKPRISVQIPFIKIWQSAAATNYGISMAAEIYNPNQRPITIRSKLIIKGEEKAVGHENIIGKPEMELFLEPGRNLKRLLTVYYPFNPSNSEAYLKCYEVDGTEVSATALGLPTNIEVGLITNEVDLLKIISDLRNYWKLYFKLVKEVIEEIKQYKIPLPADWTKEKRQKLKDYLAEMDNTCLSLKINRRRLYFFKQKWGVSDAAFENIEYKYYYEDINNIDDILQHYKLAEQYKMLDGLQKTLEDSYYKFLDELNTLETTVKIMKRTK